MWAKSSCIFYHMTPPKVPNSVSDVKQTPIFE